jgi:hypothetical protein
MNMKPFTRNEHGNALFLILIAVALFAALSYAVTQSGRGGGGVDREQALISASQVTQYGAGLRTTVTRMVITGSAVTDLEFDSNNSDPTNEVFHTSGGGAVDQAPPATAGTATSYTYMTTDGTNGFHIIGIGTDTTGSGQDVIVGVDGLTLAVCRAINSGLGLIAAPTVETTQVPMSAITAGTGAAGDNAYSFNSNSGEAFACVDNGATSGGYVYYHALVER